MAVVDWELSFVGARYVDLARANVYLATRYSTGHRFWESYDLHVDQMALGYYSLLECARRVVYRNLNPEPETLAHCVKIGKRLLLELQ